MLPAFAASLVAIVLSALCVQAAEKPSDVHVLSKGNFTEFVQPHALALVEFYAPWCGHCQALAPHYEASATQLKAEGVVLAKVDCTAEEALCAEQEVSGFPTLKVFRHGVPARYGGPRKTEGIVSYMRKQLLPAVSEVDSRADLDALKSKSEFVLVGFADKGDKASLDAVRQFGEARRDDVVVGVSTNQELAAELNVRFPSLVALRTFDQPQVVLHPREKTLTREVVDAFATLESLPLVDEIKPENFMKYAEAALPLAYYFVDPASPSKEAELSKLRDVARKYRGKLSLVWIDATRFASHAKALNLGGEQWPAFAMQDLSSGAKYTLEKLGNDPAGAVGDFLARYASGKAQPSVKSAPVPEKQEQAVIEVVADEFDKYVLQSDKDVLVEFYAPWCTHCKRLAPTYAKLAELYANDTQSRKKVQVVKMDATANDVPPSAQIVVTGFPTIALKPAGKGAPQFVDYEGDRSLESFIEFIASKGSHKVSVKAPAVESEHDEL